MAGGKNNTQKIEALEELTNNLVSRLDVVDFRVETITALQNKGGELATKHGEKLVVIEERLVFVAGLQSSINLINSCDKEIAILKEKIDGLLKDKQEQKEQKKEASRRLWAFGPNLLSALIAALVAIGIALLNFFWLNPPK